MPRGDAAGSQTTKATLGLRELIFAGELAPEQRVPEIGLAERLGVSRTPLRLALGTLAHEGLLRPLSGGGFVVCSFTLSDVSDAIELRGVLEGTAARFAAERLESQSELADLVAVTEQLDAVVGSRAPVLERYVELNDEYHRALVALAKSDDARESDRERRGVAVRLAGRPARVTGDAEPRARDPPRRPAPASDAPRGGAGPGHGARAEDIAREHARLAKLNLELVLESEPALERLPGRAAPAARRLSDDAARFASDSNARGRSSIAAELVTSRGLFSADSGRALREKARELAANPRIDVLSITDNPGGHAMLAPDTLGSDLLSLGQEVIIHLACKDWNRNALESRGWKLGSEGFRQRPLHVGRLPGDGPQGHAAPVFDIDSVGLISMLARDERGPAGRAAVRRRARRHRLLPRLRR